MVGKAKLLALKRRRDLRVQRGQFLAAGVVALLGVALFGASYDSYRNLRLSYSKSHTEFRFADLQVEGGPYPDRLAERVKRIDGIELAEVRPVVDVGLAIQGARVQGRLTGVPAGHQPEVDRLKVLKGRYLSDGSTSKPVGRAAHARADRTGSEAASSARDQGGGETTATPLTSTQGRASVTGEVLVERHFADARKIEIGDRMIAFFGSQRLRLRVAGIVASPEYIWPAPSLEDMFVPAEEFAALFVDRSLVAQLAGGQNQLLIYENGRRDHAAESKALALARPYGITVTVPKADQPSNHALNLDLNGFRQMAIFFPLLFLIVTALTLYVLIARLVQSQRHLIGYLRAEGMLRAKVVRHYLGFGLVVTMTGGILGIPLGAVLGWQVTKLYTSFLAIPTLAIKVHPETWVIGLGLVVVTGLVAAGAPSRFASRIQPAEALRGELPALRGRRSFIERLIPPLKYLPRVARLVLRNAERNPRRSLATGVAVILALVLMLTAVAQIDSMLRMIDIQFNHVQREDDTVFLERSLPVSKAEKLAERAGATVAVGTLSKMVMVSKGGRSQSAGLTGLRHDNPLHSLPGGGPPRGQVLLGRGLADGLEVRRGDTVEVSLGKRRLDMKVDGLVDEPLTAVAYTTLDTAQALIGNRGKRLMVNEVLVGAPPPGRERMNRRLQRAAGVQAVQDAQILKDQISRYLWLMYVFGGVMLAFGAAMAFALIFATVSANLAERRREVGTLRAIGMEGQRTGTLLGSETVYLVALALAPGLVLGTVVAGYGVGLYSDNQFYYPLYISPRSYVLAVVALLVAGAVSFAVAWRGLKRISLAVLVRERGT